MSDAQITIRRIAGNVGVYRNFNISLDGEIIGKIANGETKSFKVTPGHHVLRIKIDWGGSNRVAFQIGTNETTTFNCESSVKGVKLLLWFVYATILSQSFIKLKRVD